MKEITYKRVKRKLFTIISKTIHHNYFYKPIGIYHTSKEYIQSRLSDSLAYVEVYPELLSTVKMPGGLYAAYTYLKPSLSVQTTYIVVEIAKGRLHTDNAGSVAVISDDNMLIADVSFSYQDSKVINPERNSIFRQKYFEEPKVYKGVVFNMLCGGSGLNNYGHWLIDVLPRIHLLQQSGLFEKVDYFLVPSIKYDFQRDSLKMLGIPADKIIVSEWNMHIKADTLMATTAPRGNNAIVPLWIVDFLRKNFMPKDAQPFPSASHIYVSRKDSKVRNVTNEAELMALLSQYNFTSYELSSFSFIEKIRLFASADVVVSATGAGLTNIVFCKKGTKILEIFNDGFVVGPFYDLADKADLLYDYIICSNGSKAKNPEQGQEEDITVDLQKVKSKLLELLESTSQDLEK